MAHTHGRQADGGPWRDDREALLGRLLEGGMAARLFALARLEDLGPDDVDVTSEAALPETARFEGAVVAREPCVAAGLALAPALFEAFGASLRFETAARDGERVEAGRTLARLEGSARMALRVERTLLNLLGRLSGVATLTAAFVERAQRGGSAQVLDTRKTTPGLRLFEKYAVACGGGRPHRWGLYDAALLKDNHLAQVTLAELPDVVRRFADRARQRPGVRFVEVEVDSLAQLETLLRRAAEAVDVALLDNMAPRTLRRAVALRDELAPSVLLEASGGVTLQRVEAIARSGVDRISVGALTREARWIDVSLEAR